MLAWSIFSPGQAHNIVTIWAAIVEEGTRLGGCLLAVFVDWVGALFSGQLLRCFKLAWEQAGAVYLQWRCGGLWELQNWGLLMDDKVIALQFPTWTLKLSGETLKISLLKCHHSNSCICCAGSSSQIEEKDSGTVSELGPLDVPDKPSVLRQYRSHCLLCWLDILGRCSDATISVKAC